MNTHILGGLLLATSFASFATAAHAEDVVFSGDVTDVFGDRIVVRADDKKYLVNLGPKSKEVGVLSAGTKVNVDGDLKKSGEVRAHKITLADGRVVEVGKDKKSWMEWLTGDDDDGRPFTATDAKAAAFKAGYTVSGDPVGEKKHFVAEGTKDGKTFDLKIERDGDVEAREPFKPDDAKAAIVKDGYEVVVGPDPVKEHFEALARKDGKYFEVHTHRDGDVKEVRSVEKGDARFGAQIP